ncbi:MAG: TRAP transporter large permease [candidate division NC10 bacterium]
MPLPLRAIIPHEREYYVEPSLLLVLLLFGLLVLRVPVAVSLALSAFATLFFYEGGSVIQLIAQRMYPVTRSWVLLAIPFFMLAGTIMEMGGLTRRIVNFSNALVGFLPGGLAAVTVVASMIFGGVSGSSSAETSALGSILIPAMKEQRYAPRFAAALVASSACIGMIIPPSIPMVLWSFVSGESLGKLFMAGLIPGILIGLIQIGICVVIAQKRGYGIRRPFSTAELGRTAGDGLLTLVTPLIIIGGIVFGFFTPTEAAIIAVFYSLFLSMVVYKELRLCDLPAVCLKAGTTSAMVLFIVAGSSLFSYALTVMEVPALLTAKLLVFGSTPLSFILITGILYIILGMIMDISVIILLTGPILAPLIARVGLDPIQTAMIYMVILAVGLVTPPVGMDLFVASGISGLPIEEIAKECVVFVFGMLLVAAIIWFVPATALWLPARVNF